MITSKLTEGAPVLEPKTLANWFAYTCTSCPALEQFTLSLQYIQGHIIWRRFFLALASLEAKFGFK